MRCAQTDLRQRAVFAAVAFRGNALSSEKAPRGDVTRPVEWIARDMAEEVGAVRFEVRDAARVDVAQGISDDREVQPVAMPADWGIVRLIHEVCLEAFAKGRVNLLRNGLKRLAPAKLRDVREDSFLTCARKARDLDARLVHVHVKRGQFS